MSDPVAATPPTASATPREEGPDPVCAACGWTLGDHYTDGRRYYCTNPHHWLDGDPPRFTPAAVPPPDPAAMEVMEAGHRLTGAYIREYFAEEDSPPPPDPAGTAGEEEVMRGLTLVADNLNESWCERGEKYLARDETIVRNAIATIASLRARLAESERWEQVAHTNFADYQAANDRITELERERDQWREAAESTLAEMDRITARIGAALTPPEPT